MLPKSPSPEEERRIIPFRRPGAPRAMGFQHPADVVDVVDVVDVWEAVRAGLSTREPQPARGMDAARHYLKFMLPAIPITAFLVGFLFCYLLTAISAQTAAGGHPERAPVVDPVPPLLGALLLSLSTGILCLLIYWGFLRVSGLEGWRKPQR